MTDLDGKRTERIEAYVSLELELWLRRRAEAEDRKVSQYVCRALLEHARMVEEGAATAQQISPPKTAPLRPVRVSGPFDDTEKLA